MPDPMKLLLVGNPNAGKSTLFNRLTKGHAKVGNWHGVTVGALEKEAVIGGKRCLVCDLPGIYSLDALSMEEKLSRDYIAAAEGSVILFVAECAGLGRAMPLLCSVAEGRRTVLILTKRKQLLRAGGFVDGAGLSRHLGLPVLFAEEKGFSEKLGEILDQLLGENAAHTPSLGKAPNVTPSLGKAPIVTPSSGRGVGGWGHSQSCLTIASPPQSLRDSSPPRGSSEPPPRGERSTYPLLGEGPNRYPLLGEGGRGVGSPSLPASIYRPPREELSRADAFLLNGLLCVPLFLALMLLVFFLTFAPRLPGDVLKGAVESFFTDVLGGFAARIPSPVVRSLVKDGILSSLGSVLCFLPQISMLYLFLIFFEESGLLSRLAYLTDGLFSRVGLNGRAVFSLLMGFGCTAAAVLTTRGLDDKKMQRRAILSLPYIPCSAKLPVFLTLTSSFFKNPFPAVAALYLLGVLLSFTAARLLRGKQPPFLMEIAPLQLPDPIFVLKSLLFQIKQFIIKTATVILAFLLLSWALSSFDFSFHLVSAEESMLARLCGGLKWLFAPAGMGDWRIAYAALSGLVAKENVAGAIQMFFGEFPYGFASAAAFAVFLLTCSPCVSAVAATAREVGWKRALLYAAFQTVSALLLCYLTYFLLKGGAVYALLAALPIVAFLLVRDLIEKLHRSRRKHPEKVHG